METYSTKWLVYAVLATIAAVVIAPLGTTATGALISTLFFAASGLMWLLFAVCYHAEYEDLLTRDREAGFPPGAVRRTDDRDADAIALRRKLGGTPAGEGEPPVHS